MSTTQDYEAAEQLPRRPGRPGELIVGDRPQWIGGGARFWNGVSTGAGKRFVLVDPAPAMESGQGVDPQAFDCLAYVRKRRWDSLVRELLSEMFA